jgi:hypothetical protein
MASDFTLARQYFQKEQCFFSLRIKLHAPIQLRVSPPSFDTGARNGVMCCFCQSH